MVENVVLGRLRRQLKELRRSGQAKPLVALAEWTNLAFKATRDIVNLPAALAGMKAGVDGKSAADCVDIIFDRFGGLLQPYQNRNEIRRAMERIGAMSPGRVLEIGTARGGTLFLLSQLPRRTPC